MKAVMLPVLLLAAALQYNSVSARDLTSATMVVTPNRPPKTFTAVGNLGPVQPNENDTSTAPQQVHLTYWKSLDKMLVSFVTGSPKQTAGPVTDADLPKAEIAAAQPTVRLGTQPGKYSSNTGGKTTAYIQNSNWQADPSIGVLMDSPFVQGYVSGLLHHVLLTGLQPGTTYYYSVAGHPDGPWSKEFNFTTYTAKATFPFRIGYMGDLGNSKNATATARRMVGSNSKLVAHMGDISYADVYAPNGTYNGYKSLTEFGLKYRLTYQAAWDQNARMLQELAAHVPMLTTPGNHELEFQPDGTVMAAYNLRYPVPQTAEPQLTPLSMPTQQNPIANTSNMYYSVDVPGVVHMVFITPYIPKDTWEADTAQYKWLEADLKSVNRTVTPWLIVNLHAPLVSSWEGSFKDAECMRLVFEPLLYKYKVDLVFNGHTHAYERMKPVYNYTRDPCGAVHITIGCGGKPGSPKGALDDLAIEDACGQSDSKFYNATTWNIAQSLNPTVFGPPGKNHCPTVQPDLGGFCWPNGQPDFSAVRTSAFGYGTLDILNATHAEWAFYRNHDAPWFSLDKVMLDRSRPKSCASPSHVAGRR